jgi:MerR family transcriptional regulator, redox-sensitive transcriptional activator SoxR
MDDLTIGEVARRAGVRTSALRYYERAGILPPARRVNGQRRYSAELLDLVQVARFAQSVGFSLEEVRALFRGFEGRAKLGSQWRPMARAKLKELDTIIEKARQMKAAIEYGLGCGCIRIDDCLPAKSRGATRS